MDTTKIVGILLAGVMIVPLGVNALPDVDPVVDNPLGSWDVDQVGITDDGTPIWRITFDIHENTGTPGIEEQAEAHPGMMDGCYIKTEQAFGSICGEYAFKIFQEASAEGVAAITFPGGHGVQVDNLDNTEQLHELCNNSPDPTTCMNGIRTVDENFGGFSANLCGGPQGEDDQGDIWVEVAAPHFTEVYVGSIYETLENFDGSPPDTEGGPCVQNPGDQTDFPGRYTGISFSETIVLEN